MRGGEVKGTGMGAPEVVDRPHQRSKAQEETEGLGLPFHPWPLFTALAAPPSLALPLPPPGLLGREGPLRALSP